MADALGSIVALTDSSKNISNTYAYEAFGTTSTTGATNKNCYEYTGRENDGTVLYYYRARYYHPALARFVSEDPLRGRNADTLYLYVRGNPLLYIDPSGARRVPFTFHQDHVSSVFYSWTIPELPEAAVLVAFELVEKLLELKENVETIPGYVTGAWWDYRDVPDCYILQGGRPVKSKPVITDRTYKVDYGGLFSIYVDKTIFWYDFLEWVWIPNPNDRCCK